jgi:hypothetical protein
MALPHLRINRTQAFRAFDPDEHVGGGRTATSTVNLDTELPERVVERLFSAGLLIESPRNETALGADIHGAIAELDEAIADITSEVLEQAVRSRSTAPAKAT